jgi:uncharacterized protein (DUF2267 family)
MNKDEFIKRVMELADIQDKHNAERGVQIVLSILSHRLMPEEQHDTAEQLPPDIRRMWNNDVWITNFFALSGKRLNYRHKIQLMSMVENEILRENLPFHTESLTRAVFHVLKEQISFGEVEDIASQLPDEIKDFFKAA